MKDAVEMTFAGPSVQLELLDPRSVTLARLFRHPGGQWDPPPEQHRTLRVDPPPGHQADYAVLYLGETLPTIAMECRVLSVDDRDRYTWKKDLARQYQVVRYAFELPALFLPIDGVANRAALGLEGSKRRFLGYDPYRGVALEVFKRYGNIIHGLSWESFHRNQPGRVYALWHHHKATIGLKIVSAGENFPRLIDDEEWAAFLADYPEIEAIEPTPADAEPEPGAAV
jgi:hypothetical protein